MRFPRAVCEYCGKATALYEPEPGDFRCWSHARPDDGTHCRGSARAPLDSRALTLTKVQALLNQAAQLLQELQ